MQRSDSFVLAGILSFSGGLQDAYTFNIRDHVFANAQTGNVVIMSQNFMMGRWEAGIDHLFAVFSFIAGVFLADCIEGRLKYNRIIHWRQVVLMIEVILLFIVGFLPRELNVLANIMVSFSCAMQVQSFRALRGKGYASTMCIGNLKSGTSFLAKYFRKKKKADLLNAVQYYAVIVIFAVGAGFGGVLSRHMGIVTIWVSCILLFASALFLNKEHI